MSSRMSARFLGGLIALLLAVVPIAGTTTMLLRTVQIDDSSYQSPQFGYVVTWDDQWAGLDRHVVTAAGERDEMMLSNNDGRLWVIGYPADVEKSEALLTTMDHFTATASEVVITAMDNAAALPYAEMTADRDHLLIEVQPVEDATVAIVLMAREDDFDSALQAAQEGVFLNNGAILVHEPVPAVAEGLEATEEPTEEPRETEEPTEEPAPTEEPEPTEEPVDTGEVWESEQFGVSLDLPPGWTLAGESSGDGTDVAVIENGASVITIYATSEYTDDLSGCVSYARTLVEDDPTYDSLRLQATADGQPYEGSDDRSAYALFSYTTDDDVAMAWYVHCQPIEESESILILMQDVPMEDYQEQRTARATVINAIDFP
ncbi:MAG TPA: hypothetical protein VD767_00080 [Thermomicrobiales bacterium]|nr:hypothetical protein [Thermomicrobiales bacterium]